MADYGATNRRHRPEERRAERPQTAPTGAGNPEPPELKLRDEDRDRAPVALAASILVMAIGAGLLALTVSTTPQPAEAPEAGASPSPLVRMPIAEAGADAQSFEPARDEPTEDQQRVVIKLDTDVLSEADDRIGAARRESGLPIPSMKPTASDQETIATTGVAPSLNPRRKIVLTVQEGDIERSIITEPMNDEQGEIEFGAPPSINPRAAKEVADVENKAATSISDRDPSLTPNDENYAPRLKPRQSLASATVKRAAPVKRPLVLGGVWRADDRLAPPPFYFTSDITRNPAPPTPLALAFDRDFAPDPDTVSIKLSKGETFVDALRRAGVRAEDRNAAAYAFAEHQNLRTLRPGQEFVLTTAAPNKTLYQLTSMENVPAAHLLALDFRASAEQIVSVRRDRSGDFESEIRPVAVTSRLVSASGRINGSLYLSAKRAGAPDEVIAGLADMFAYDIDFQREIFGGDEFEAIFEIFYDENGNIIGGGDILYGRLNWRGRTKEKGYYRFASADGGKKADYFDRAGQSAKRLLMKTPIDGARLSSGFGTRRHPILGYAKAHKGVDFAARRGTPIKAAGDGVVERANRYGSFGNYIRIRHANGYKTAYAHLNGFRKGIRAGKRVEQGDIIGYVGTTGRSTGPHLHYEVHLNGKAVNPQRLKIATGVQLKGAELDRFKAVRDEIDAMRIPETPKIDDAPGLLAKDSGAEDSL